MKIEDNLKIVKLIDAYGVLLTSRQYDIVSSYYFDNLSLSEIGENFGISRQAVSDCIGQSVKILEQYEDKLHSIKKSDTVLTELSDILSKTEDQNIASRVSKLIDYIRG